MRRMNNQIAILIAGAMVAGSILIATGGKSDDREQAPAGTSAPAEQGSGSAPAPALVSAPEQHQATRNEKALEEALAEIGRLKEQVAALSAEKEAAPGSPAFVARQERFLELKAAYGDGTATKEQVAELLKLSKDKVLMDAVVEALTSRIEANPADVDVRMQLAEVQSARVHAAESITERAALGRSVGEQIRAILEQDPEHWDARYMRAVGISHSQRTPQGRAQAIREFESLIAVQQSRAPEARFARTYGQLALVHVANRDIDKARRALQQGLAQFPDATELRTQLSQLPTE